MNDLVKQQMNEIITDDVLDMFEQLHIAEAQVDSWRAKVNEKLLEVFKSNGIKSFKNDYIEITYVAPSIRKTVDTAKLKEEGIYDFYTKDSQVKESIRIKFKEVGED